MTKIISVTKGIFFAGVLAIIANSISSLIPHQLISGGVFALLLGMALNPFVSTIAPLTEGFNFTSKKLLKLSIILMGLSLSFSQVLEVGKFSIIVMTFTLITAFGGGYLLGKLFGMDWKLSSLISAGTGICGGSAIAAIAPVIEAKDSDIAYGISATFIFDVIMVVMFPIMGRYFMMSDMGFGLWAGTAVNDTSSVVAAGYAFSDAAGQFAVIVKLTRTLSIIPVVLIFSFINTRIEMKKKAALSSMTGNTTDHREKVDLAKIFPWFILLFLAMVAMKSTGIVPMVLSDGLTRLSKFLMVMALGAIGLKTNFSHVAKSGFKPMLHGFIISLLVVVVSFFVQMSLGQI